MNIRYTEKLKRDKRVAFVRKTKGGGFYVFLNKNYFYGPDIANGNGMLKANFIHRHSDEDAYDAMDDVIFLDTEE
jgi:hypothetical protein